MTGRTDKHKLAHLKENAPEYIDPSGHFVFYENLCSSNFFGRTSTRCCSRGSPGGWIRFSLTKLIDTYHRKIK